MQPIDAGAYRGPEGPSRRQRLTDLAWSAGGALTGVLVMIWFPHLSTWRFVAAVLIGYAFVAAVVGVRRRRGTTPPRPTG